MGSTVVSRSEATTALRYMARRVGVKPNALRATFREDRWCDATSKAGRIGYSDSEGGEVEVRSLYDVR